MTQALRDDAKDRMEQEADASIEYHRSHPEQIDHRLQELAREWSVERLLQTGSAVLSLYGLIRWVVDRRRWLLLPLAMQAFVLREGLRGCCPPARALRSMGFRTAETIERERQALLGLR